MVLVLAGLAQVIYGVGFHTAAVVTEKETAAPPPIPGPPPGFGFGNRPPPPPPRPLKLLVLADEAEFVLIREVTFGGVTRLESGELKRTYSGRPPSLCPT